MANIYADSGSFRDYADLKSGTSISRRIREYELWLASIEYEISIVFQANENQATIRELIVEDGGNIEFYSLCNFEWISNLVEYLRIT